MTEPGTVPEQFTEAERRYISEQLSRVRPVGLELWRNIQQQRQADNANKQQAARELLALLERRHIVRAEIIRQLDELIAAQEST